jgi:hypothetical protein
LAAIPIAVFTLIDAGTASSSPFQRTTKNRSRSRWNRVHFPLESAFTMRWKPRSRTTGICNMSLHSEESMKQRTATIANSTLMTDASAASIGASRTIPPLTLILLSLLTAACGTYNLGNVRPQANKG